MSCIMVARYKVEVTDLDTGVVTVGDWSTANWRKAPALMRGDCVVMWTPRQLSPGVVIRTSGRRWRVIEASKHRGVKA